MSYRISCYTLFDITKTGIYNRSKPDIAQNYDQWLKNRNTQANFDTILQIINLRSQPEVVTDPKRISTMPEFKVYFGSEYHKNKKLVYWHFTFDIMHHSVFDNGIDELGSLYSDCHGVPMILCGSEYQNLSTFLDASNKYKNIHFGIHND